LEERVGGNPSNGRHTTFFTPSSYDNDFENPEDPVINVPQPVEISSRSNDYAVYETTAPTVPMVENYTQETDYIQSESIMDSIDNKANSY
jgi:hypothetical protein